MTARAYLRYSPSTFHDKVVVDGYPPGAFAAFSAVLCLAEEQPERGRFRSEKLLRLMLDEPKDGVRIGWGKWIPYLLDHGDLARQSGGSLYVVGWDEWQEGDVTVAERMARMRARRGNGADSNADQGPDTPPTVTGPSDSYGSDRTSRARATTRAPSAEAEATAEARSGGVSAGPSRPASTFGLPDDARRLMEAKAVLADRTSTAAQRLSATEELEALGATVPEVPLPRPLVKSKATTDEERIEELRAKLADPATSGEIREAVLAQLSHMGVR